MLSSMIAIRRSIEHEYRFAEYRFAEYECEYENCALSTSTRVAGTK